jgi:hypothetical protein
MAPNPIKGILEQPKGLYAKKAHVSKFEENLVGG